LPAPAPSSDPRRPSDRFATITTLGAGLSALALLTVPTAVTPMAGAQVAPPICEATAYIVGAADNEVARYDIPTRTPDGSPLALPAGSFPDSIVVTPDGATAFVGLLALGQVATIDTASNTITGTIDVGNNPNDLSITPDGATLYVPNGADGTVSTIDVATRTKDPVDLVVGAGPQAVAFTPDGTTAFVSNSGDDSVSVIDVATRTVDPTAIAVGNAPSGLAVSPDGADLYVPIQDGNPLPDPGKTGVVTVIDVATRTVDPAPITGFQHPLQVLFTGDGVAFVVNGGNTVSTIDVATRTTDPVDLVVGQFPVQAALTPDGTEVWVANLDEATVSVIDVDTRTVDATAIPVTRGPSALAFGPCASVPPTTSTTTVAPTTPTTRAPAPAPAAAPVTATPRLAG